MSFRAFIVLAAVTLVAVAGAAWAVVAEHFASSGQDLAEAPLFPALADNAGAVERVAIKAPNYELTVERRGDEWVASELGDYPTKAGPVAQLVAGLASMRTFEAKTDNPDWYKDIAVQDPGEDSEGVLITATGAGGEELANIIIGARSQSIGFNPRGGTFVREPGEAQAILAEGGVFIPNFIQDWFNAIVHIPGPQVRQVTVLEGDTVVFDAEKVDPTTGDYELVSVDEKYAEPGSLANDNAIKSMSQGIVSTTFENARPRDSVTFAPDARTVRFRMEDELQIELKLAKVEDETWVTYTATAPEGSEGATRAEQITSRTGNWAFRLPSYRVAVLEKPITELVEAPPEPDPEEAPADPRFLTNQPLMPMLPGQAPANPSPALPVSPLIPGQ
jgi:hypothetical protein